MIQHEDYIEFDPKALFFYILRQWKTLLICGLCFAVLLGGFQAFSARTDSQPASPEVDTSNYTEEYQAYVEKRALNEARLAYAQECVDNFQEYMDNSLLMQVNHQKANTAKATYYVADTTPVLPENTAQIQDKSSTLVWLYNDHLKDRTVYENIAAALGIDVKYLPELITLTPTGSALTISVYHPTLETAGQIMDLLQEELDAFYAQLEETVGEHSITCTQDTLGEYVDHQLHLTQNNTHNHLINLQDNLLYYESLLQNLEAPELPDSTPEVTEPDTATASPLKWAVIGGVIGVILAVVFLFMKSILGSRIHTGSQLTSAFHAPVLGEAICSSAKLSFITRKVNAMEGCLQENSDGNFRFIACSLENRCGAARNILICGDSDAAISSSLAQSLNSCLSGIRLQPAGSVLKDADALRALTECDAVVLVAARDDSRSSAVRKMLDQIQSYQKEVLGFIVTY